MARCVGPRGNLEGERKRGLRMNNKDLNLKEREIFLQCNWSVGERRQTEHPSLPCSSL